MKDNIKICLFNPIKCISYPPLNLTFIASYLLKYGRYKYDIKLVDVNFSDNPIGEIMRFAPHVVGFTSLSPYMLDIYDFCKHLRDINKDILLICGGVHATINPQEVIENGFDVAVVGEGEITFQELIDRYIESFLTLDYKLLSGIDGIVYRNNEQRIVRNKEREAISNLDIIPHPARYLLNNLGYHERYYIIRGMNTFGVYTLHGGRGCPYRCIFCCVNFTVNGKVRLHSPEYIVDEVDILVNRYKAKWIFFTDDTFLINKEHVKKICNLLIDKGLNRKVNWEVQVRTNLIKEQDVGLLRLMRKAGCRQVDIGFESGSQRMLTLIKGVGITIDDHRRAIDLMNNAGINVMGTFILGTPSETYDEMMDTRQFIMKNYKKIHRFQIGCMIPYPGTRVYEMAVGRGIIKDNYLELLQKEKRMKSEHGAVVYSDTIPQEEVLKVRIELDNLSLKKVSVFERAKWLIYNIIYQPKIALNGCRWGVIRFYRNVLSLFKRKYICKPRSLSGAGIEGGVKRKSYVNK